MFTKAKVLRLPLTPGRRVTDVMTRITDFMLLPLCVAVGFCRPPSVGVPGGGTRVWGGFRGTPVCFRLFPVYSYDFFMPEKEFIQSGSLVSGSEKRIGSAGEDAPWLRCGQ